MKRYINTEFPQRAGEISLRFINGNFRAQGWQGQSFSPWQKKKGKGTILIKTGKGRRGTHFSTSPGVTRVWNDVGYMAVHNKGFHGTVQVPAHQRRNIVKSKMPTERLTKSGKPKTKTVAVVKGITMVRAHTMKMNIPKRQFMPISMTDSPVLANALAREITRGLKQIFE